ncbi:phage head spike fiber domain-containing protein [Ruegeria sp.]|uniref:phage head spike fiber domain-containing protein n=1 Tax=Ruegeria sp. TaxID=1879320 RepID=UPI003C7A2EBD
MRSGGRFLSGRFAYSDRSAPGRDPRVQYAVNGLHPNVVADFRNGVHLGADASGFETLFMFLRSSVATYTDATGTLSMANANEARIDHRMQDGQWVSRGVLLESEARTNLLLRSADFSHATWSKTRASVVVNDGMAPDGTQTANRLISTASTYDGAVRQTASYSSGQWLSFSVYAKAGDRDFVFLRERTSGFAKDTYFDLRQGVLGTVNSIHTADLQDVGNGWFRCSISVQATRTAASDFEIYNSEDDLNTASTQSGDTYIWGAQLEVGATPSSYIATQDGPVTRAADALTVRQDQVVDPIASNAVSLAMEGDGSFVEETGATRILHWDNAAGDRITVSVATNTPDFGRVQLEQSVGGIASALETAVETAGPTFALASRHTANEIGLSGAGVGSASGLPDLGQSTIALGPDLMGHITLLRLWSVDIGPTGLLAV